MHNPESVLEDETRKLLRDFEMQTDHQISARQPDLLKVLKKCRMMDFAVPADHRLKIKEQNTNR